MRVLTSWRRGSVLRNVQTSLGGSLGPAAIGVGATILLGSSHHRTAAAVVLLAWSIVGYVSLTDFGLTRSASRLASAGHQPLAAIVASLWRASIVLGAGMALAVVGLLTFIGDGLELAGQQGSLWLLVLVPVVSALQFPVVGLLEAKGSFTHLAAQRIGNAICTYMIPAVLVIVDEALTWIGTAVLVGYRVCALVWLWRVAGVGLAAVRRASGNAGGRAVGAESVRGVAPWVAASSLLGSFFLYVDRGLLALSGPRVDVWVTYVAISELMLKTYVVPTAVLSVAFPWMIANMRPRHLLIRRLLLVWAPLATLIAAVSGGAIAWLGAPALLDVLGANAEVSGSMTVVLAVATAATLVNWSSQGYVAFLQAVDSQRVVVATQAFLILPFIAAAVGAFSHYGVVGLSLVWGLRILLMWALLVRRSVTDLRLVPSHQTGQRLDDGTFGDMSQDL